MSFSLGMILIILAFETIVDAAPDADALDTININLNPATNWFKPHANKPGIITVVLMVNTDNT